MDGDNECPQAQSWLLIIEILLARCIPLKAVALLSLNIWLSKTFFFPKPFSCPIFSKAHVSSVCYEGIKSRTESASS